MDYEKKSVFLCKNVDSEFLGREVYTDNVETPHNFYLIRELNVGEDYQSLAEGESYFDAICDSWDEAEGFVNLVVKKIYMYVETDMMYFTLLMGSFDRLTREMKLELKGWLEAVVLNKTEYAPATVDSHEAVNLAELNTMMKQVIEASNEMFRLRKMIGELTETIGQARLDAQAQPVISRSVHTIHLKRAQPLIVENEAPLPEKKAVVKTEIPPTIEGEYSEDASIKIQQVTVEVEAAEEEAEIRKKPQLGLAPAMDQGDTQLAEEGIIYQNEETNDNVKTNEKIPKKESSAEKLRRKNLENQQQKNTELEQKQKQESKVEEVPVQEVPVQEEPISEEERRKSLLEKLLFEKNRVNKRTPSNWPRFSRMLADSYTVAAPKRIPNFSRGEMENLEDDIYLRFMSGRMNVVSQKNKGQMRRIDQVEMMNQITKAEYLNYSWGQVLKQREEDVLICSRLSSADLVGNMDEFLAEMKRIVGKRSFFRKKVKCSVDKLRKLEGYVLMDEYMRKLS